MIKFSEANILRMTIWNTHFWVMFEYFPLHLVNFLCHGTCWKWISHIWKDINFDRDVQLSWFFIHWIVLEDTFPTSICMLTFVKDLLTIQGIFHRSIKTASTNANTNANIGAKACASFSKELQCNIFNLTHLSC